MKDMSNTSQAACAPPINDTVLKDSKYIALVRLFNRVNEVVEHLENVNAHLGVYGSPVATSEKPEPKPPVNLPDNLVDTLDRLPTLIDDQVSKLHDMLNELQNSLS